MGRNPQDPGRVGSPADNLLSADGAVPHPEPELAVELECKPHVGAFRGQVPCCVPLLIS